jgi:hypothetical protein
MAQPIQIRQAARTLGVLEKAMSILSSVPVEEIDHLWMTLLDEFPQACIDDNRVEWIDLVLDDQTPESGVPMAPGEDALVESQHVSHPVLI